jgi:choline dehydrogenase
MECDVVVVGGGSAGCALVGRLCQLGPFRIVLLEAGPDYGRASSGRWPAELLDAASVPATHQWDFLEEHGDGRLTPRARARVIGGCSAHNECGAKWPVPAEFELWAAILGDTRWGFSSISPLLDVIEDAHGASLGGHEGTAAPCPLRLMGTIVSRRASALSSMPALQPDIQPPAAPR